MSSLSLFPSSSSSHSNGSIKFWNTTSSAMDLVFELKTSSIFQNSDGEDFDEEAFSEFQWPPYRKVGSYDPFDDDTRLSIRFIEFCPFSLKLCIGGEGGQALTFAFNPEPAEVRVEVSVSLSLCVLLLSFLLSSLLPLPPPFLPLSLSLFFLLFLLYSILLLRYLLKTLPE